MPMSRLRAIIEAKYPGCEVRFQGPREYLQDGCRMCEYRAVISTRATIMTDMIAREVNHEVAQVSDPDQYPASLKLKYGLGSIREDEAEAPPPPHSMRPKGEQQDVAPTESESHSPTMPGDSPRSPRNSPGPPQVCRFQCFYEGRWTGQCRFYRGSRPGPPV